MADARNALERFVRWVMRDTVYHGLYAATVELQHDDGSVDLLPDDDRVMGTGLSRVPIRHGLPGVTVKVVTGSRVLLGFVGADPRRPYASLWEPGTIQSISFHGGTRPIARVGDPVTVFFPVTPMPITGQLGGSPFIGTITIPTPGNGIIGAGDPQLLA
jgi:hypothetical protein